MKVAVACDGMNVAPYFAQCTSFMCYDIQRGIVVNSQNMPLNDQPAINSLDLLKAMGIDTLIVGRIEYEFASKLCHSDIEVVAGAEGSAVDVMHAYLTKTLSGVSEPCSIEDEFAHDADLHTESD